MKLARLTALCMITAFALIAALAGSAFAEAPEYGRCLKVAKGVKGKFATATCTTPATTEKFGFEWHPGAVKTGQTTLNTTGGTLETVNKLGVHCASETSTGEYGGTKEVKNIIVKFKGCESGGFTCTSPLHEVGELETKALEGMVEFTKGGKALKKTVFDLFPAGKEGLFIEFACVNVGVVKVEGSILVSVPSDKMLLEGELKFIAKTGHQKPEEYENASGELFKDVLMSEFVGRGKGFEQAGQTITTRLKNEEKLELNAVV